MSEQRGPGRRISERRAQRGGISRVLAVAFGAMLLTGGALAVQKPADDPGQTPEVAPATRPVTSLSMICPAGVPGGPDLVVASGATDETGDVASAGEVTSRLASAKGTQSVDVGAGEVATVDGTQDAVVVTGSGSLAPGLFGARFGSPEHPAAGQCATPSGERWFVGVGGGGLHESRILLANPDSGPAVADVSLWSPTGQLVDVASRGLTIPGQSRSVLDLAELAPNRDELAALVTVSRGRVAASMSDTYTPRGGEEVTDWLPSAAAPATTLLIPGLPRRMAEPTLVLANPGDDAGRVSVEVVGERSTFKPNGLEDIRVGAGQVTVTELPGSLVKLLAEENASLKLTSDVPVVGSLKAVVAGDLVHLPAAEEVSSDGATALPGGTNSILTLTPTDVATRVTVAFPGLDKEPTVVRLVPGTTTSVPVPAKARAVVSHGTSGYVGAVRTVTDNGASLLPLRPLELEQLIPAVRPQWP